MVDNLAAACRTGRLRDPYVRAAFRAVTFCSYLQADFARCNSQGALKPEDVPCNRIYPTGAAVGILLDFFRVNWKTKAAQLSDHGALTDLLEAPPSRPASLSNSLRKEAESRCGFPQILSRTRRLAAVYLREARDAVRRFEEQRGWRIQIQLPVAGTSRSRSSTRKRWVTNDGQRVFGTDFIAYTLRRTSRPLLLTVQSRAVIDDLLPHGERRVAFFVPSVDLISVDGSPLAVTSAGDYRFVGLRMQRAGFSFDTKDPGTLSLRKGRIAVSLTPAPR